MKPPSQRALSIYRHEGLAFNLVCGVHFLVLSPLVVATAKGGIKGDGGDVAPAYWLGVLLVLAMLLEIRALPEKMKFVLVAVRERDPDPGSSPGLFPLWMFHAGISVIVLFQAGAACGVGISPQDPPTHAPLWFGALLFLVVIKELYLLFAILGMKAENLPAERYGRPNRIEWRHDLVIVAYSCLAYSVTWGMMSGTSLEPENRVMFAVNLFAASLLFLAFYLPMRIPYLLEEWAQLRTAGDKLRFAASILAALAPALWALG